MTPLPKKKHSRSRSGKRANAVTNKSSIPALVKCSNCGNLKYPHTLCESCGSYR